MPSLQCGPDHKSASHESLQTPTIRTRNSFPSRIERAQEIADSGRIVRSGSEFLVPSLTSDAIYRVRLDEQGELRCNCPDFQRRQQACKHQIAVSLVHAQESK